MPSSGGALLLEGVPPGEYRLSVTLHRYIGNCDTCSEEPIYPVVRDVNVVDGNVTLPAIDIFPGIEITGVIHWEQFVPKNETGVSVRLTGSTGLVLYTDRRDPNWDSFRIIRVQPDRYKVQIQPSGHTFSLREAWLNGKVVDAEAIVITPEMQKAQLQLFIQ